MICVKKYTCQICSGNCISLGSLLHIRIQKLWIYDDDTFRYKTKNCADVQSMHMCT